MTRREPLPLQQTDSGPTLGTGGRGVSASQCRWPECVEDRHGYLYVCHRHAKVIWLDIEQERDAAKQAARRAAKSATHKRFGCVYYLEIDGMLKIGFTTHLPSRLRAYPPGTKVLGTKRGTMADEMAEHQRCTPWRTSRREWYELNDSTRRVIAEAVQHEQARLDAERAARAADPPPPPPRPGHLRPPMPKGSPAFQAERARLKLIGPPRPGPSPSSGVRP